MVVVKLFQIRMSDRAIVFRFFEDGNEIGSRGVNLDEETFNAIVSNLTIADFFRLKQEGFELPEDPKTELEKVAVQAYNEFLQAKRLEEQEKEGVLE